MASACCPDHSSGRRCGVDLLLGGFSSFSIEVEIFAGSVADMGKKTGIPTPVNNTFLNLIQVMEA